MAWDIEYTDEFEAWWRTPDEAAQDAVAASVGQLEQLGPTLRFPYSSGITTSQFDLMRELRVQHKGEPYRVLYAFDPRRVALLLIGGKKPVMIVGTINSFLWLTDSTCSTLIP
jgi:hypothetical protein